MSPWSTRSVPGLFQGAGSIRDLGCNETWRSKDRPDLHRQSLAPVVLSHLNTGTGTDRICYNSTGAVLLIASHCYFSMQSSLRKLKEEFSSLDGGPET